MKLLLVSLLALATAYACNVIQAPNSMPGDQFGFSAAGSGNLVVGTSPYSHGNKGSAYLYNCNPNTCTLVTELTDPNGADGDQYGYALAFVGRTLLITAPTKGSGAFFAYDCDSVGCTPYSGNPYVAPGLVSNANFGNWIAFENGMVAVAAFNQSQQGAVYAYSCDSGSLSCTLLTPSPLMEPGTNNFGYSVAISGSTLAVGGRIGKLGRMYLYTCSPGGGCTPFSGNPYSTPAIEEADSFGNYFSICGSYLTVGSLNRDHANGAVEGFYCSGNDCVPSSSNPISSPNTEDNGYFGDVFSCANNVVLTAAQGENDGRGRAYLYTIDPITHAYSLTHTYSMAGGEPGDNFGFVADLAGSFAVISAPFAKDQRGLIYILGKTAPYSCQGIQNPNFNIQDLTGVDPEMYGGAVSMSGSLLVVGASDKTIDFDHQGAAIVYTCNKNQCAQLSQLVAFDAADYDSFGYSVAVDGTTVVVGAPSKTVGVNEFQGAAYVYSCPPTGCTLLAKLTSSSGSAFDDFGTSVAVSGNTIIVGADQVTVNGQEGQGQAYLFQCNTAAFPGTCGWVSTLDCASCSSGDLFGYSVAISGSFVTVGAPFSNANSVYLQGQALGFDCTNPAACVSLGAFTTATGAEESYFGWAVTASGWHALIGAPFEDFQSTGQGAVYPLDCTSGACTPLSPLLASNGYTDDNFGYSVSLSGSAAVLGASGKDAGTGSAYLFDCTIFANCKEMREYGSPALADGDYFGAAVTISGNLAAAGAPGRSLGRGQTFIFGAATPTCDAIIDGNANWPRGTLNTRVNGACLTGWVGSPYRFCQLNSTFGPIFNPCIPASQKCGQEIYGHANWSPTNANLVATGACVSGYSGSPQRKCNSNAAWATNIIGVCNRNYCPQYDDGTATYPKTGSLDVARGTCDVGYIGAPTRTCQADGSWGVTVNPCTSAKCIGETYGKNIFQDTPVGQLATGSCVPGYFGSPKRQCTVSGWSTNVVNNCARITCTSTISQNAIFPSGNSNTVVYGTCISGTGNPRLTCDITGNWVKPIGVCA